MDVDGSLDDLVTRDVVGGGVDRDVLELLPHLARHDIEGHDAVDGVAEHLDPQRLLLVGRMDLDRVAPGPERPPDQIDVIAGVLQVDELAQDLPLVVLLADREPRDAVPVLEGEPNRRCTRPMPPRYVPRMSSDDVVACRRRSISSLIDESFSM